MSFTGVELAFNSLWLCRSWGLRTMFEPIFVPHSVVELYMYHTYCSSIFMLNELSWTLIVSIRFAWNLTPSIFENLFRYWLKYRLKLWRQFLTLLIMYPPKPWQKVLLWNFHFTRWTKKTRNYIEFAFSQWTRAVKKKYGWLFTDEYRPLHDSLKLVCSKIKWSN